MCVALQFEPAPPPVGPHLPLLMILAALLPHQEICLDMWMLRSRPARCILLNYYKRAWCYICALLCLFLWGRYGNYFWLLLSWRQWLDWSKTVFGLFLVLVVKSQDFSWNIFLPVLIHSFVNNADKKRSLNRSCIFNVYITREMKFIDLHYALCLYIDRFIVT